jgi:hypothetical protein
MKKHKKFKDEHTRQDSKRIEKKKSIHKKKKLTPFQSRQMKYRNTYINEEE